MKTEINLENKAKFFAQYWGQYILCYKNAIGIFNCGQSGLKLEKGQINLKSLDCITDQQAKEIAVISGYNPERSNIVELGKILVLGDIYTVTKHKTIFILDYLRSKGYALPWMGLSVDEMIEAGWIKLQEG